MNRLAGSPSWPLALSSRVGPWRSLLMPRYSRFA